MSTLTSGLPIPNRSTYSKRNSRIPIPSSSNEITERPPHNTLQILLHCRIPLTFSPILSSMFIFNKTYILNSISPIKECRIAYSFHSISLHHARSNGARWLPVPTSSATSKSTQEASKIDEPRQPIIPFSELVKKVFPNWMHARSHKALLIQPSGHDTNELSMSRIPKFRERRNRKRKAQRTARRRKGRIAKSRARTAG